MSVVCEKVLELETIKKAAYEDVEEFVLMKRTERPKGIPIAEKWSLDPCFMPEMHRKNAQKIVDFAVRSDDVWLVGFPKSGTTWTQELIWLICNDLDYEGAAKEDILSRYPLMEIESVLSKEWNFSNVIPDLENRPSPRFIKSHLPPSILPTQLWTVRPKIVYVARNFKDMVISCYHHYINVQGFRGSFDDFIDVVLDKKMFYASYHPHVSDFFNMRNEENVLFLTYEDMKKHMMGVLRKTSHFFGKNYSEAELEKLAEHLSFASISKNPSVNQVERHTDFINRTATGKKDDVKDRSFRFIRRGESGAYLDEMPQAVVEKLDKFTESEIERLGCDPEVRKVFYFNK